ncbi:NAD-dependent epimerase/dehydratase family protein [Haladaptatus pallidirubidus]|uniref:SDR family oxidoreductase n=1 Tax=Haladaptatus pallidirubidus TaxID=1008152 RepID=A0AAV3UR97_9EURY|nr:NAD(P)-dependent oxidoreductase [Haladaptatus pallidirubidus]
MIDDDAPTGERTAGEKTPTIAVTGAAGYIGSRVLYHLAAAHPDWTVTAMDNFWLGDVRRAGGVEIEHVDLRDRGRLESFLDGADVVLHLAAITGVQDCEERQNLAYEVNVGGTNNVAWFCRKTGAALVFPFSMAVLGDPTEFPITVDHPRDPLNWYGRTKLIGEHTVADMADGAFPAHCYLKSNLYGEHEVDGRTVSKGTVINFFVNRVAKGQELTVYEPGTQSRNYIHVDDVAQAYVKSAERLLDDLDREKTGAEVYEIAGDEDMSVLEIAELVQSIAAEETGWDVEMSLVENPRPDETLVETFDVNTARTRRELGWRPERSVAESVRSLLQDKCV